MSGRVLYSLVFVLIFLTSVALLFDFERVVSRSMMPEFKPGDLVIACNKRNVFCFKPASHGDLVFFRKGNTRYFKRVIAVGGDIVSISEREIVLNGNSIPQGLASSGRLGNRRYFSFDENDYKVQYYDEIPSHYVTFPARQIPDNSYFVLGDNRGESIDSRSSDLGFVSADEVTGSYWFKI